MTEQMKNALKGQGEGLQSASTTIGNLLNGGADMRGAAQKKDDEASSSITEMQMGGKRSGPTVESTSINAQNQMANQQTGHADHLDLGFRK